MILMHVSVSPLTGGSFAAGLFKLQELVKTPPAGRTEMYIRQASPASYRQVLKEVRQKEIYKLIVDTNPRHMSQFFRAVSASLPPTLFYVVLIYSLVALSL